ncbi:MAG: competence/damage-inducible protein A [Cytophagales bacterium]|nr:competence/damage-inducible protein A [Cytophagales bacterium]
MKKDIIAEIISIGDEILIGQILNTNAHWMGQELHKVGIKNSFVTTIGDNREDITNSLIIAQERADIVLITGGLGPTKDDITKKVLADFFESDMYMNQEVLQHVKEFFESRNRVMSEVNKLQALVPSVCTVVPNELGTAPCMWFEKNGKVFVSMPGVPFEMKNIMSTEILPRLKDFFETPYIAHRVIQTIGIGESYLAEKIQEWENKLQDNSISLAYLPSPGFVKLRLSLSNENKELVNYQLDTATKELYELVPEYIFGEGDDCTIQQMIGELLTKENKTIATAESCTGGYLAHLLTSISGSSAYFMGSVIAYSNQVKIQELNVPTETLQEKGAVSEETVRFMAENIRTKYNTTIGLACSGIAGPNGGTKDKPVGTIWIAYSDEKQTISKCLHLTKKRDLNIHLTATACLNLVRKTLTKKEFTN